MAYNEELTKKLRVAFAHIPNVVEKKMFRGVGFMVNGKLCASAGDDELMFRIGPEPYKEAITKKGVRPMIMKGREYTGYVYVKEDSVQSQKDLQYWLDLALGFNKKIK